MIMFGWTWVRVRELNALKRTHNDTLHRAAAGDQLAQGVKALLVLARRDGGCGYLDTLDNLLVQHGIVASGDAEQMAEHVERNHG